MVWKTSPWPSLEIDRHAGNQVRPLFEGTIAGISACKHIEWQPAGRFQNSGRAPAAEHAFNDAAGVSETRQHVGEISGELMPQINRHVVTIQISVGIGLH